MLTDAEIARRTGWARPSVRAGQCRRAGSIRALVRSSGCPELDDEVLAMIERASPLPPTPPEIREQMDSARGNRCQLRSATRSSFLLKIQERPRNASSITRPTPEEASFITFSETWPKA